MLQHPSIPAFVCGNVDHGPECNSATFFLVHRNVKGEPLSRVVERSVVVEADARTIARSVLEVLVYLHGRTPPVVHRDIKPSNLVRRPDGGVSLIDFGALQQVRRSELTVGSTIIGTPGFVAPEQMMGRALPASDLYSLGATLVQLLSGRNPSQLPSRGQRIDFRPYVRVSQAFAGFLSRLLAPLDDRFRHAAEALAVLSTLPRCSQDVSDVPQQAPLLTLPITRPDPIARSKRLSAAAAAASMILLGVLWVAGSCEPHTPAARLTVDGKLPSGQRIPNTRVVVDGVLVCTQTPGNEPGPHLIRLESAGKPARVHETIFPSLIDVTVQRSVCFPSQEAECASYNLERAQWSFDRIVPIASGCSCKKRTPTSLPSHRTT